MNMYEPDKLKDEAIQKRLILDIAVDVQVILQLMVRKGIITEEELNNMRTVVKNAPKYKSAYDYIDGINEAANTWENDPMGYLSAIWKTKTEGKK